MANAPRTIQPSDAIHQMVAKINEAFGIIGYTGVGENAPTDNLRDGMTWFDPVAKTVKMYLGGAWYRIGDLVESGTIGEDKLSPEVLERLASIDSSMVTILETIGEGELRTRNKTLKSAINELSQLVSTGGGGGSGVGSGSFESTYTTYENRDELGIYTKILYTRDDHTLSMVSELYGGESPLYPTNKRTFYGSDGLEVIGVSTFTLTYDAYGDVVAEELTAITGGPQLNEYNTYYYDKDVNGIFKRVEYIRVSGTLHMVSKLSGGTSPKYTTNTQDVYDETGTTITGTKTYSISYDEFGDLVGSERIS